MDLYLVRHGITAWNQAGRYQGWADPDLAPEGVAQALHTAAFFAAQRARQGWHVGTIYSSPLRRAWHTASIIGEWIGREPVEVPDLREMHGGAVEGLTQVEWQARYPALVRPWSDPENQDFGFPGSETRREFAARATRAIAALAARHAAGDQLIVVAHGGLIKAYLTAALPAGPAGAAVYEADNCSITHVRLATPAAAPAPAAWAVECLLLFNHVEHLRATGAAAMAAAISQNG